MKNAFLGENSMLARLRVIVVLVHVSHPLFPKTKNEGGRSFL